jgi:hypothetical protein
MKSVPATLHETGLVLAFIVRSKQERLLDLLARPQRRKDVLNRLYRAQDLEPRWMIPIQGADRSAPGIERILRSKGARDECYVLSTRKELDGATMALNQALRAVVGGGGGTLLSCIPGALGYYEGETPKDRWILERADDRSDDA